MILFWQTGCRKIDTKLSSIPTPESSFFNVSPSVSADIQMVVRALQDSNARYRFVPQLQKVYGNPVWNKIVANLKTENDTSVYLTNSGTQSAEKIYFIPLQKAQLLPVGAYIVCVQSDTVYKFSLFQKSKLEVATPETVDAESYILAALSVFSIFEKKLNDKDTLHIAGRYNKRITDARIIFSSANSTNAGIALNSYSSNTLTYCYRVDCESGTSIPWGTVSTWVVLVCEICHTVTNFQGGSGMGGGGGFSWPGLYSFHEFLDPATGPDFGGGGGNSGGGGGGSGGGLSFEIIPDPNVLGDFVDDPSIFEDDPTQVTFDYNQDPWPTISNVLSPSQFVGYDYRNCLALAKDQIAKAGLRDLGYGSAFKVYDVNGGPYPSVAKSGINYIMTKLKSGKPVIVGVDNRPGTPSSVNVDGKTDHFITIVGSGQDSRGKYLTFFDNATNLASKGCSSNNKLYYDETTGVITGYSAANGTPPTYYDYIVTQIRKNQ